jgi:hypothetical protein
MMMAKSNRGDDALADELQCRQVTLYFVDDGSVCCMALSKREPWKEGFDSFRLL